MKEGRRKKEEDPSTTLRATLRSGYEEGSQQRTVNSEQSTVNSQLYKNRPQLLPVEEWCFKIDESEQVQANPVSTANPKR
ncbi:MAG: hypothetical protein QQW96_23435 [Tychonema bourrellyi B0820]|nr:hypothetical protein [Tychonema bourrellyi B0820]